MSRYQRTNFQSCKLHKIFLLAEHFPKVIQSFNFERNSPLNCSQVKGLNNILFLVLLYITLILTNQRINIGSIKARMFVVLSRWEGQSAGFFFSLLWLIFLKPDSLRISPRSRTIFLEAACIILYRDSDANSKDCRARPPPRERDVNANGKGAWFSCSSLVFFSGEEKPGSRVEACVKRDASRDSFATKRHGKIVEKGANLQGDRARNATSRVDTLFSNPFQSFEWSCREYKWRVRNSLFPSLGYRVNMEILESLWFQITS